MDELQRAMEIGVTGDARERALGPFREQLRLWGIAMPKTEPLVWDFGLGQFGTVGLIECWIANEGDAGYCGKYLYVSGGQTCPLHHHKIKHETFFMVEGEMDVVYGGESRVLRKGDLLPVPPPVKHSFTGRGPALVLELSKPCRIDDNFFEDEQIPIGGNRRAGQRR